jgi:hypothetical protein
MRFSALCCDVSGLFGICLLCIKLLVVGECEAGNPRCASRKNRAKWGNSLKYDHSEERAKFPV